MTITPKTMARQIRVAAAQRAEVSAAPVLRLAFTSETGVTRPQREARPLDDHEEHCFVCGRHTDHWGEHDDMVEQGFATYGDNGDVYWTQLGWEEFKG